jgi:hypothetical protein
VFPNWKFIRRKEEEEEEALFINFI